MLGEPVDRIWSDRDDPGDRCARVWSALSVPLS
jgi:hypothetical protein